MHLTIPDAVYPGDEHLTVDTDGPPGLFYLSTNATNAVSLDVTGALALAQALATFLRSTQKVTGPTYNHTRGDSALTPCSVCADFR
jgi:hypothetical protein